LSGAIVSLGLFAPSREISWASYFLSRQDAKTAEIFVPIGFMPAGYTPE
jgi:hypothetical protein